MYRCREEGRDKYNFLDRHVDPSVHLYSRPVCLGLHPAPVVAHTPCLPCRLSRSLPKIHSSVDSTHNFPFKIVYLHLGVVDNP